MGIEYSYYHKPMFIECLLVFSKSKYKIILNYINDLSIEVKDPEALLIARERILKYKLDINISSKPLKNKMIEVNTKLTYHNKEEKKREWISKL